MGPAALRDHQAGVLGDNDYDPVFGLFTSWKGTDYYRSSIARGADIFMFRQFWLRDAAHINSIGLGNPLKRTCATCHNAQMTGQDLSAGWVDVGTTNFPTWTEARYVGGIERTAGLQDHLLSRCRSASLPGTRHLHDGPRPRAHFRPLRRCRLDRHAAAPRPGRAGALLRERIGQNPARGGRFLRSPFRYEAQRRARRKTSSISWGFFSAVLRGASASCISGAVALGQQRNFVSCPIVRDTKTVPCFLAEYDGELYYLGIQQDITSEFHPPQLKHKCWSKAASPRVRASVAAFRSSPSRFPF